MAITKINNLGITDGTIVNADINASAAIDSTKLTGVNDAKAWVNFNGTGTVAIRASFNVTSITDNSTGNYTVNFTTALADSNYSIVGICTAGTNGQMINIDTSGISSDPPTTMSTTAVRIIQINDGATFVDGNTICLSVFR